MARPVHLWLVCGLVAVIWLVSAIVRAADPPAKAEPEVVRLPVTQVTLYTAGVACYRHEGMVDGNARTELRFPEADVNDLIKSLVLTDAGGGKVRAVTYDNKAPIEYTLKSFSIDVTENPSIGQLLHQVRGEKVSVTDKAGPTLSGMIVSVEREAPAKENQAGIEQLNLLTDSGLQSIELKQARRIAFLKPELQDEFMKALTVLAAARGDAKKGVSITFDGNGKRKVGLGYVVEAPIWKASYRLALDEKGGARLQGWATVENTTDEDWTNVKVGLVAGRPVSFQMDMYDPLFVPRPQVEPELFASLRPPMYQGVLTQVNPMGMAGGQVAQGNFLGIMGGGGGLGFGGGGFGGAGGGTQGAAGQGGGAFPNLGQFGNQGNFLGIQGSLSGVMQYLPRTPRPNIRDLYGSRLGYDDYLSRVKGEQLSTQESIIRDPLDPSSGVVAMADSNRLGDSFKYTIDEPVTLPRMKSALLPILNEAVDGSRISIFNGKVLSKHPLLGLKLTNKTKLHLAQGPVTVYEGDTFAGDARLADLKPGETRLVSFAIDLGTEVLATVPEGGQETKVVATEIAGGNLFLTTRHRSTQRYIARNRDTKDRTLLIEHPVRQDWKLTAPLGAVERSRDFYRFEIQVKAGETARLDVVEELTKPDLYVMNSRADADLLFDSRRDAATPAVRAVLTRLLEIRGKVDTVKKSLDTELASLREIGEEQDRIRKNIERVPKDSDAYRRYLKKFDDQETEIETRQARVKALKTELTNVEMGLKDFLASAKAE